MAKIEPAKLTPVERQLLEQVARGRLLTVDADNVLRLGNQVVGENTRASLMKSRLLKSKDVTLDIKSAGNGFILSERGWLAIEDAV